MREFLKHVLPQPARRLVRRVREFAWFALRRTVAHLGFTLVPRRDYYSPLRSPEDLLRTRERWDKPSAMVGVAVDLSAQRARMAEILNKPYFKEFSDLPSYEAVRAAGYGQGYDPIDATLLYVFLRTMKPARYLEVGSGISTWYAVQAADRNAAEGMPMAVTCIEPLPSEGLRSLPRISLISSEVQEVSLAEFEQLEDGDVLFIDSTHVVRIDGDVPFLYLEVLPRLREGVYIHVHDIQFPWDFPIPATYWLTLRPWPRQWTEAMMVHAFLAFNSAFEIWLSAPMLLHHDEGFVRRVLPNAEEMQAYASPCSSLWLRRVKASGDA